jgi:putative SbcD/Mre11-related phosphoesterase
MQAVPIYGQPLLLVEGKERVLVAADLHLGLEHELWLGGVSIPSQTGKMLKDLREQLAEIKPDRLVLLGDVKHSLPRTSWQEWKEVPSFLESLSLETEVEIVLGNHDVGLAEMAAERARVHPSTGFMLEGVGYFHGHTWPSPTLFSAELLIAAHLHPAVRLIDPLGHPQTRRAWIRAHLSAEAARPHYGRAVPSLELVIVPAFNPLCGGLSLNELTEGERGPLPTMADLNQARAYLMDGTDLGRIEETRLRPNRQRSARSG